MEMHKITNECKEGGVQFYTTMPNHYWKLLH
jgi:ribosomal protein L33